MVGGRESEVGRTGPTCGGREFAAAGAAPACGGRESGDAGTAAMCSGQGFAAVRNTATCGGRKFAVVKMIDAAGFVRTAKNEPVQVTARPGLYQNRKKRASTPRGTTRPLSGPQKNEPAWTAEHLSFIRTVKNRPAQTAEHRELYQNRNKRTSAARGARCPCALAVLAVRTLCSCPRFHIVQNTLDLRAQSYWSSAMLQSRQFCLRLPCAD